MSSDLPQEGPKPLGRKFPGKINRLLKISYWSFSYRAVFNW